MVSCDRRSHYSDSNLRDVDLRDANLWLVAIAGRTIAPYLNFEKEFQQNPFSKSPFLSKITYQKSWFSQLTGEKIP